ncbi:MAG: hypothetical protein ACUVTM_03155 [Candidatus Bathyarchaeia archaeon]
MTRRRVRPKRRRFERTVEVFFIILAVCLLLFILQSWLIKPERASPTLERRAALIDQLSTSFPNQTFVAEFRRVFKDAGFTVDIYSGSEVTLELYRRLPSMGYRIIVFRVHQSTPVEYLLPSSRPVAGPPVYLFTGEPYSEHRYVVEQLTDLVVPAREINGSMIYFAIGPKFIHSMYGKFQNTVIILAGCSGLYSAELADSFIVKGASVVVGWQRFVQIDYTDAAICRFIKAIMLERTTIYRGILSTLTEIGLDHLYKTSLICYPEERSGLTVEEALRLPSR